MYDKVKYLAAGDRGLIIEFGDKIEEAINYKIRSMLLAISTSDTIGIIEMVPTYRSIMVIYDPMIIRFDELIDKICSLEGRLDKMSMLQSKTIEIPTVYGGEYGPDINFVAEYNKITTEEVIKIHTSAEYLIYMIGFTPGFPYLGGMPEKIAVPRHKIPRTKIPAGSVGIAGSQTGIYPIESPGGWQLIGRTPVKLYDPYRDEPVLLCSVDHIRFIAIDEKNYQRIVELESQGKYKVEKLIKNMR